MNKFSYIILLTGVKFHLTPHRLLLISFSLLAGQKSALWRIKQSAAGRALLNQFYLSEKYEQN